MTTGVGRTKSLSVHKFRRTAEERERDLTKVLDTAQQIVKDNPEPQVVDAIRELLKSHGIPEWAKGVRVEKAGMFSYAVVATEDKGH